MLKFKRFDFSPILGWSVSRYDTFATCKRKYFYQYYAKYDPDFTRERIDALKKLTSIPLETGNIAHDIISTVLQRLLKSNSEINRQRFQEFVDKKAELNCKNKTFFEVHYAEKEAVTPVDMLPTINESLSAFLGSPRFEWVKEKAIKSKNDWLIEPPGYGETRINDMKAYCKVDFLFVNEGRIVILDWKTGKRMEEKHGKQLLGYSAWAAYHLNADAAKIDPILAYLRPAYEEVKLTPSTSDLENFAAQIRVETDEMYALCSDVEENAPMDKATFEMTANLGLCKYCNYKELCNRI